MHDISLIPNYHTYRSVVYTLTPRGFNVIQSKYPTFPDITLEVETANTEVFVRDLKFEFKGIRVFWVRRASNEQLQHKD